jgi:hypothetical protein
MVSHFPSIQASDSIPPLFFEFLNNEDLKIVGVGMEKAIQKLKDDCRVNVTALHLGILVVEKYA